jgi:Pyridine nucleotide-disulphide oxidoreductase
VTRVQVAIVGAGPYGLSLAAHLAAHGISFRAFGQPMAFWTTIAAAAPERFLKSFCFGTNIPVPDADISFPRWSKARGLETFEPCAMGDFVAYGHWIQQRFVPTLEEVWVERLSRSGSMFQIVLSTGEVLLANQAVIATGLSGFEYVPPSLAALPKELLTHSNGVKDFAVFRSRNVAVIGGGQSALEAAALLREAGAQPELFVREPQIRWMSRVPEDRSPWQRIRSPISGLGAGPKAWLLTNFPGACRHLPDKVRISFVRRHLPPEGAWWLRPRVDGVVETRLGTQIVDSYASGSQAVLELMESGRKPIKRQFDHVVAATGFQIDVDRLSFVDPELASAIARIDGSPRLNHAFESSVAGLFFVGPTAAMSFGPLYRFVIGAAHAALAVRDRLCSVEHRRAA